LGSRIATALFLACLASSCHDVLMASPSIRGVEPGVACLGDEPTVFEISGDGFTPALQEIVGEGRIVLPRVILVRTHDGRGEPDASLAEFEVPSSLEPGEEPRVWWLGPMAMGFVLDRSDGVPGGMYAVRVMNPDGSRDTMVGALFIAETPRIGSTTPLSACVDPDADVVVDVQGGPFVVRAAGLPIFYLEGGSWSYAAAGWDGCATLFVQGEELSVCSRLSFVLPPVYLAAEPTGEHRYMVASVSGCTAISGETFRVIPCPAIDAIAPPVACVSEEDRVLSITGSDLVFDGSVEPRVLAGGRSLEVDSLEGCVPHPDGSLCESLRFTYPRTETSAIDHIDVRIDGLVAEPCCAASWRGLVLAPPPSVWTTTIEVDPDLDPPVVWIRGRFIMHEGELPVVTFAGAPPVIPDDTMYCDYIAGLLGETLTCQQLMVEIPGALLVPGAAIPFFVTNPDPVGCTSTEEASIHVAGVPP
jgi:hypothetical protein